MSDNDGNVTNITNFGDRHFDGESVVLESVGTSREICDYIAAKGDALYFKVVVIMALLAMTILVHVSDEHWHWVLLIVVGLGLWRQTQADNRARDIYDELEQQ